ncbi:hypothetical protein LNAOJCKE_0409 [Methylorubrum aminovorans]|uniref:Peptidase S74 domain-containing protein n=1 Tax=Methylorubrum aminovorans TaxID=269069 RepID=A0ABQ4UBR7_9HYPH|nr:tail fiber domain-containing protein [Methylorubrum aminovorans]GJE63215.1 hypothetical protein LNAOJCKE_0409 [Methylorubrum aminovorans]GMA79258.1 hypothetical protein GCM10025880_56750 [Methylorubrum aminovorans]
MGGLASSKSETKTSKDETTTTRPLPEQMPYLNKVWTEASSIYDRAQTNPYTGPFVAAPNANQYQAFDDSSKWAQTTARDTANSLSGYGQGQLQTATAGQQQALSGLFNTATADNTASNIARANQYASQQNVGDIVKAASFDARRNAAENVLPSLYRNASGSGNINSSRTALAEGVVNRGLAEQEQNLSATTRANLFNNALSTVGNENAQRLQALGGAGTLSNIIGGQGYTGTTSGFDAYGKALTAQQAAGYGQQQLGQNVIDNNYKMWNQQNQFPWDNAARLYSLVGDLKGGVAHTVGTGTSETTQTPSMLSTIGQGIGLFGSLFSDERYKDIKSGPIGSWNGVAPAYLYSYKHDPSQLHVGPKAQEVAKVRPDVVRDVGGALVIDTHKL